MQRLNTLRKNLKSMQRKPLRTFYAKAVFHYFMKYYKLVDVRNSRKIYEYSIILSLRLADKNILHDPEMSGGI